MVWARSAAEMPVEMPCAASMDTVKLVPYCAPFFCVICGRLSRSTSSSAIGRQTRPRACLIIKLTASGVTDWAAIIRSPSFSRSSASVMMTILPALMSARISGMGETAAVMAASFVGGCKSGGLYARGGGMAMRPSEKQFSDGLLAAWNACVALGGTPCVWFMMPVETVGQDPPYGLFGRIGCVRGCATHPAFGAAWVGW